MQLHTNQMLTTKDVAQNYSEWDCFFLNQRLLIWVLDMKKILIENIFSQMGPYMAWIRNNRTSIWALNTKKQKKKSNDQYVTNLN